MTSAPQPDRKAQRAFLAAVGPSLTALVRRLGLPGAQDQLLKGLFTHLLELPLTQGLFANPKLTPELHLAAAQWLEQRRKQGPVFVSTDDDEDVPDVWAGPKKGAETLVKGASHEAELDRALTKLPHAQRRAFVLLQLEKLNAQAVTELEGVPMAGLKSRFHHARAVLALELGHLLDAPVAEDAEPRSQEELVKLSQLLDNELPPEEEEGLWDRLRAEPELRQANEQLQRLSTLDLGPTSEDRVACIMATAAAVVDPPRPKWPVLAAAGVLGLVVGAVLWGGRRAEAGTEVKPPPPVALGAAVEPSRPAPSEEPAAANKSKETVVELGHRVVSPVSSAIVKLSVGDPRVVKARLVGGHFMELLGLRAGSTTVVLETDSGKTKQVPVVVSSGFESSRHMVWLRLGDAVTLERANVARFEVSDPSILDAVKVAEGFELKLKQLGTTTFKVWFEDGRDDSWGVSSLELPEETLVARRAWLMVPFAEDRMLLVTPGAKLAVEPAEFAALLPIDDTHVRITPLELGEAHLVITEASGKQRKTSLSVVE